MPLARSEPVGQLQNVRTVIFGTQHSQRVANRQQSPVNHDHDSFPANHADVTFVGRPFPVEDAPDHFARLRRWGLTFSESPPVHVSQI